MGIRVSRLSDTGVALCRSISNVKKPAPLLGVTNSGLTPYTIKANVCNPGSPCSNQYR